MFGFGVILNAKQIVVVVPFCESFSLLLHGNFAPFTPLFTIIFIK